MIGAFRELGVTNPLTIVRTIRNFVRTIWDPTRSDIGQGIGLLVYRGLKDASPGDEQALGQASPELLELFNERYDPPLDLERLATLPDGTLGREWVRFVTDNGIRPLETLLAFGTPQNLLEYQFRRAYKMHDLMHVVLGADASVLGEVRIVSYSLGQAPSRAAGRVRAPAMALAVLIMNIGLRRSHEMGEAVALAAEWLRVGARSPWHVAFRVEDWLERPVAELRAQLLREDGGRALGVLAEDRPSMAVAIG